MFNRPASNRLHCELVTYRYAFSGELNATGGLVKYLTDPQRAGLHMTAVSANLLDPSSSAMSSFSQDELIILKDYTVFLRFDSLAPLGAKSKFDQEEKLLVYTERFVVQGFFQSSSERNRLLDLDGPTGRWAVARDVLLHPLIPTSRSAPATGKLVFLNKAAIQFFHSAKT